ncbi:hypothetical protein JRO89_XS04G0137900 [Xanthoceras sorbifolium]|uniref:DUF7903 domain-containing protein n=1 Tax=Xanthoceras sorbifolium TaxID=99658 RepID=A0ABQ8I569_9ROSI|nr:hypothetical protein JRO89_XS04G0137900 [Xanthoceras sorbifolium]
MAYIPPHKRHSKDSERPSPIPELLVPKFTRKSTSKHNTDKRGNIVYAENAIFRWFIVGLDADNNLPSSVQLEPISVEAFEQRMGEKPLVLLNSQPAKENDEEGETMLTTPWESVAVNVWQDLLSSFEIVRNKMESKELDEGKPALVARFGKILFHGYELFRSASVSTESVRKDEVAETTLRRMMRSFYTNTSSSYMENIISGVGPKIGVDLEAEKDIYHIKLSDSTQPKSAILCKCRVTEDRKLELYKASFLLLINNLKCVENTSNLKMSLI